ncbi:MAG: sulfatase [Verrucomicrobia bacterium]|nr:sulfatase [Verrucomicrobiota bacterium]
MKTIFILLCSLSLPLLSFAAEKPNILFIVSDDLTACLGCYGNKVCKTPHLDRLAREGVLFERAYCQFPVCGPSRASFMSGLYPHTTKMMGNSKDLGAFKVSNPKLADHPSIGEFLRQNGYFSARISKIYHMGIPGGIEIGEAGGDDPASWDWTYNVMAPETRSPGKAELLSPKRAHAGSNFGQVIVPDELEATQADILAAQQAVAILENRQSNSKQPFFLAVGFIRPHVPLVAPQRLFDLYPVNSIELPVVPEGDLDDVPKPAAAMENIGRYGMNEEQQRKAIAGYYASVSFMDEQVGKLLDALDRLDLRKNTIVIFTSDHGYNLGEHSCWQKLSLFEESTRVPLLISAPGFERSAGKSAEGIVELIDLYPTIADLIGLKEKAPSILQGTSLRPLLEKPDRKDWSKTSAYTVTHQKGESIRTVGWRYSAWGKEGEELYDLESDPQEFTNLAPSQAHAEKLAQMRLIMEQTRKRATQ